MIDSDLTQYTIQAFGLTPDGQALARVLDSFEAKETKASETVSPDVDSASRASMTGRVVLCDGLMPGETAEVRLDDTGSRLLTARLVRILKRSPDRVEPFCPIYNECGGCTCQTLTYNALLLEKQRHIRDCFLRIARIPEEETDALLRPILPAENPTGYRNHMQYRIRLDEDGAFRFGLHARKSHETVATPDCSIAHPIADLVKNTIEEYLNEPEGRDVRARIPCDAKLIVRVGTRTGQILYRLQIPDSGSRKSGALSRTADSADCMLPVARESLPERRSVPRDRYRLVTVIDFDTCISRALRTFAPKYKLARNEIEEQIGPRRYFISPESFFQINTDQAERLYDTVLEFFENAGAPPVEAIPENAKSERAAPKDSQSAGAPLPTVLDLYCGTGSIGIHLSARARRIIGIESNAQAVEDARRNARINAVPNAEFHVGLAEDYDYAGLDLQGPLTVVLDPPRKGCSPRLLEKLIALAPDHILYVSCDPATLARDLRLLLEKGYRPKAAQPVDMFPWTGHVETVVLITRVDK
ncbi:MAG: class I SAM-dependent RNA methyltransferase [Clostridiaceae bacterium]|nr:class I SAM-dependent RNA methyltransferase [Clostridiaceae bacterium]